MIQKIYDFNLGRNLITHIVYCFVNQNNHQSCIAHVKIKLFKMIIYICLQKMHFWTRFSSQIYMFSYNVWKIHEIQKWFEKIDAKFSSLNMDMVFILYYVWILQKMEKFKSLGINTEFEANNTLQKKKKCQSKRYIMFIPPSNNMGLPPNILLATQNMKWMNF